MIEDTTRTTQLDVLGSLDDVPFDEGPTVRLHPADIDAIVRRVADAVLGRHTTPEHPAAAVETFGASEPRGVVAHMSIWPSNR